MPGLSLTLSWAQGSKVRVQGFGFFVFFLWGGGGGAVKECSCHSQDNTKFAAVLQPTFKPSTATQHVPLLTRGLGLGASAHPGHVESGV